MLIGGPHVGFFAGGLMPIGFMFDRLQAIRGVSAFENIGNYFADALFDQTGIDSASGASYNSGSDYYEPSISDTTPSGLTSNTSSQGGSSVSVNDRYLVPSSQITAGDSAKLTFRFGSSSGGTIRAAIGRRAGSGDPYDMDPSFIYPFTFGGNSSYTTANTGANNIDTDTISVPITNSTDWIVSLGITSTVQYGTTFAGSGITLYRGTGGQANFNVGNVASYSSLTTSRFFLNQWHIFSRNNMQLITETYNAPGVPMRANVLAVYNPIDSITLNTDLILYVSRDNGSTYTAVTLTAGGAIGSGALSGYYYAYGEVDISAQPSGSQMVYKLATANNKNIRDASIAGSYA